MNYTNAAAMLDRLEKTLAAPTFMPTPVNLKTIMVNFLVPVLREVVARSAESSDAIVEVGDLARTAFLTARETLAGEVFESFAVALIEVRTLLEAEGLRADHPVFDSLSRMDAAVTLYDEHLARNDDDEAYADEDEDEDEDAVEEDAEGVAAVVEILAETTADEAAVEAAAPVEVVPAAPPVLATTA